MKNFIISLTLLVVSTRLVAQKTDSTKTTSATDSLFNAMSANNKKGPVTIFEASRLILSQSTETVKKNNLNFLIVHRFGDFAGKAGGGNQFFGIDDIADVYMGFEYGVTDNFNIDIGRSTIPTGGGLADVEIKYAVLHQLNDGSSPLAITFFGETGIKLYNSYNSFGDRVSYFAQAIFARSFSHAFSLQVAPAIVQDNLPVPNLPGNTESFFSLSATARLRVTKLLGIVVDYAHPFSSYRSGVNGFSDPFGLGMQVVTGGHVFTLNITNAKAVNEINYLNKTTSDFSRGQYRIGFTIARMFDFTHKEKFRPKR